MATYNPLGWQNQNGLTNYPLCEEIPQQDFLTDAKFVQFDGFLPTLEHVFIENSSIKLTITFDFGQLKTVEFFKSQYVQGPHRRYVKIYQPITDRHLGTICFGTGVEAMWSGMVGTSLRLGVKFDPATVVSIPSKDAIYTLEDMFGDIKLSRTTQDKTIFYNTNDSTKTVVFNGVTNSEAVGQRQGIRKINLVPPVDNNINLLSNDVIKLNSFNSASLSVNLVTGTQQKNFSLSTLTS